MQAAEQQAFDAAYQYTHQQMANGVPDQQIVAALVQQGWPADVSGTIVSNMRAQQQPRPVVTPNYYAAPVPSPKQSSGGGGGGANMMIGALICAIGIFVTIGSYSSASSGSGGGRYVVAWGAIIFGGIRFFKGLAAIGR